MNAYTYFQQDHSKKPKTRTRTSGFQDSQYIVDMSSRLSLSEPQMKFLNPGSCHHVNPYAATFWQDLKTWLSPISAQASRYPKAPSYRSGLEPYLLRKVTMTAGGWRIQDICKANGLLRLVLTDVCLSHVYSNNVGSAPNISVGHMNVWVSPSWLNRVVPTPGAPLTISGILYEYVSSKRVRNIGVLPILLSPAVRRSSRLAA